MNRFNTNISYILTRFWKILLLVFALAIVIFFINGSTVVDSSTLNEQAKSLETSIRNSIAQCYAIEGTYPPDLNYLKEHYGLFYNEKLFYVDYTAIGSNIMPDVTIICNDKQKNSLTIIQ